MFKYIALPLFFAAVNAGYLGGHAITPLAYSAPVVAAPLAVKTALPVATSYQNTYKVSAPVAYAAPVVKAAPFVAAPALAYSAPVAAPVVSYAASPLIKTPVFATSPLAVGHYGLH